MVDIPVRETTPGATLRELQHHERSAVTRENAFIRLGYKTVEDTAAKRLFQERFTQEFPQVFGKEAVNPDEVNPAVRRQVAPPECTVLETPEGEMLWALSFGDRMTMVVGSGSQEYTLDGKSQGNIYPVRNMLLSRRSGGNAMVDILPYLHAYENRWGREQTDIFMSLGYVDPRFFPEQPGEPPAIVMPLALKREGKHVIVDPDETTNTAIHEGSHSARRHIDANLPVPEHIRGSEGNPSLGRHLIETTMKERGAHAVGLLVAHKLRDFVDVHAYKRSMRASLGTYDRNFPHERARIGRAAYALTAHRNAARGSK